MEKDKKVSPKKFPPLNNALVLAPMVRAVFFSSLTSNLNVHLKSTLPMRLLARRMGATIAYTDEIIDKKLITCKRVEKSISSFLILIFFCSLDGYTCFISPEGTLVFQTCPEDHPLIFQLGTADKDLAVKAASMVYQKHFFSISVIFNIYNSLLSIPAS